MPIKQSVVLPMLKSFELERKELFKTIADIGFAAVEIWKPDDDLEEQVTLARENGLVMASMVGHKESYEVGGLNYRPNHDRIEADLLESIDLAARLQIPGIIVLSGNRVPHQSSLESINACAEILRRVAQRAEDKGVNLNLELLNSKVNHPGYECDHTAWGLAVCEQVNSPRIKLLYDIYHMQIMEGDIIRTIRDSIDQIGHFHTAGNPDRQDLDNQQEINYPGICNAIVATGYDLYVGHEFKPKSDPIAALREAFALCDV